MANKDEKTVNQAAASPDAVADPKDAQIQALMKQLEEANAGKAAAEQQLEEANAGKAAAEQQLEDLKTGKKVTAENGEARPDTVTIELYRDQNIRDDVPVFVNGRQYIIKRGVQVEVPREVFEVLKNKERQLRHIEAYNEKHEQK